MIVGEMSTVVVESLSSRWKKYELGYALFL